MFVCYILCRIIHVLLVYSTKLGRSLASRERCLNEKIFFQGNGCISALFPSHPGPRPGSIERGSRDFSPPHSWPRHRTHLFIWCAEPKVVIKPLALPVNFIEFLKAKSNGMTCSLSGACQRSNWNGRVGTSGTSWGLF